MLVTNLWAKQLVADDIIIRVDMVDSRYGPLSQFTVERTEENHNASVLAIAALKAAQVEKDRIKQERDEEQRAIGKERYLAAQALDDERREARRAAAAGRRFFKKAQAASDEVNQKPVSETDNG